MMLVLVLTDAATDLVASLPTLINQDVHVETYGSLGKEEKVDFILEQLRLTLAKKDFIRTFIIARKASKQGTKRGSEPNALPHGRVEGRGRGAVSVLRHVSTSTHPGGINRVVLRRAGLFIY